MLQSIKGVYKHGKVELTELPSDVSESPVIVTFLESKKAHLEKQIMRFGMFSGNTPSTEEDFKIAEFQGDIEDNLDWS
ncbi:hypothetical protein F7734_40405 [Scytonema sp. UIC 10036]|uniref:hypothetical protein n=1 Tax=Scytonema sp. UIC 10036 TaxID=2304196 RepID=UPI0012DAB36F|nr:hypothetical protein [Scytonema sp. UIC 10036]MUG98240.1 hypothetical protein [Scytonema sp. UIC 10036]